MAFSWSWVEAMLSLTVILLVKPAEKLTDIKYFAFFRTGVLCIFLCFALGIANIFHFHLVILFSIICLSV